jgi:predicted nicotinamide N-methyase
MRHDVSLQPGGRGGAARGSEPPSETSMADFIRANTRLRAVPLVPEIALHVADEAVPLWQRTEEELRTLGLPPPFWAFAWAGGQALARYLLDHPANVAGRRVLDLGAGSGLVAIAAARAGARSVLACDIDRFAAVAIGLNACVNNVCVAISGADLLDRPAPLEERCDVIVVGDLWYEADTAVRVLAFLERHVATGVDVLIGDPGRAYLPKGRLVKCCDYDVPVNRDIEDGDVKRTGVWRLQP